MKQHRTPKMMKRYKEKKMKIEYKVQVEAKRFELYCKQRIRQAFLDWGLVPFSFSGTDRNKTHFFFFLLIFYFLFIFAPLFIFAHCGTRAKVTKHCSHGSNSDKKAIFPYNSPCSPRCIKQHINPMPTKLKAPWASSKITNNSSERNSSPLFFRVAGFVVSEQGNDSSLNTGRTSL